MIRLLLALGFCLCVCGSYADQVIWKGQVSSDGTPTDLIHLSLREKYQIKVSNYINLGKWIQANEKLANDACFEFGEKVPPKKFECFWNSHDIAVCNGKFHSDHVYLSEPFVAKQNRIFFWVWDTNFEDNSGVFDVEVIHKEQSNNPVSI